jgi:wyosine [tRNA(Phe)-imidazoG37] synthetase (radical SAM superfamily)
MKKLSIHDHNRTNTGYTYIYPVISRRAGGVSVGINLNPNNACNWACVYCQVPDLRRGDAPAIDLALLERELREFLDMVVHGDWMQQNVAEGFQLLQDIAFSGNGESTSAEEFPQVIRIVARLLDEFDLTGKIKVRLISNGSLMHKASVLDAVRDLAGINGEVWFKIDRATPEGMAAVNGVSGNLDGVRRRLLACAERCPTWVQTCWFKVDGEQPANAELAAYLALLREVTPVIAGVHLYGVARPSMQPGAERLSAMTETELQQVAGKIRALGLAVSVSP